MQSTVSGWELLYKPLTKPSLSKWSRIPLTVVMGFRCKDGAVLASDLQVSRGGGTTLAKVKPLQMSNTGIVAFTTDEMAWTEEYTRILKGTDSLASDLRRVREATEEYDRQVFKRYKSLDRRLIDFEGILATYDAQEKGPHIYRFGFNRPPFEMPEYGRFVIGEPTALATAETYIRVVEYATERLFPLKEGEFWSNYSKGLVADFCDIILTALPAHVQSVNGEGIYTIDETGVKEYSLEDKPGNLDQKVKAFISSAIDEIGVETIFRTADRQNVIPKALKSLLPASFFEYEDSPKKKTSRR